MSRPLLLPPVLLALLAAAACAGDFVPIVEGSTGYLIGAKSGTKWLDSEHARKGVVTGTKLRVYSLLGQVGTTKTGKPQESDDVCKEVTRLELLPKPADDTIAIAAPWNPAPRLAKVADPTQKIYHEAVRDFLLSRGLKTPKVRISQILRIDLDGDGQEEVLISATNYGPVTEGSEVPSASPANSYSIVLLRRVVDGKVQTQFLAGETYAKAAESNAPSRYRITGLLDVDGDGKLEVIIDSAYYEGGAITIYRCGKGTPAKILTVTCGA